MILLVHLWCIQGQEAAFRTYEAAALQIWREHGGQVLEILTPDATLSTPPVPHEIQRLRIESIQAFNAFRSNGRLQSMAAQRAACIEQTQIFFCPDPGL
jgi:hypothetical protein